jgi:RNA polymerase-binding transcription factor DksA
MEKIRGFLSLQKERIVSRLRYYERLSETCGTRRPPEYIAHKKRLIPRLKEALTRLEQGLYGICKGCGGTIARERLMAIPAAIYCPQCQERSEHDST